MNDLNRLAQVLGMLGSQHDGEVLNAARQAERIRRSLDRPWSDLVRPRSHLNTLLEAAEARAKTAEQDLILARGHIQYLLVEIEQLTPWYRRIVKRVRDETHGLGQDVTWWRNAIGYGAYFAPLTAFLFFVIIRAVMAF